jgi:branched-chain amino acid transport system permease protein
MSGYVSGLLILVGINIIAVLGVSILTGFTRLFSFGNAGFMAIGAYTAGILSSRFGVPFIPALIAGALMAGLISLALGKLTLGLKGDYFLIATLGFGESLRVLIENIEITGGARGLANIPPRTTLLVVWVSVVIAIIGAWNFLHSKYGRNLMAIREQEMAADAVGIDTAKFKTLAFVISAIYAGWAGGLFAHYYTFISPISCALSKSAELTITVVVGGLGSLTGSIIATILLTLLPELLRAASVYRMLFYGIAVVLIVTLRPNGLLGYREFSWEWVKRLIAPKSGSSIEKGDASMPLVCEIEELSKRFGGVQGSVISRFVSSLGRFYGLIGPNGAGKTTIFNTITGITSRRKGKIKFEGGYHGVEAVPGCSIGGGEDLSEYSPLHQPLGSG